MLHRKVLNQDIINLFLFVAIHKDSVMVSFTGIYIADAEMFVFGLIVAPSETEIVCFETEYRSFGPFYLYAIHHHITDISTAVFVRFKVQRVFHGADGNITHIHVLHAAGHLTADAQSVALRMEHAVPDNNVLGSPADGTAVRISSGFNGHRIVPRFKGTILN